MKSKYQNKLLALAGALLLSGCAHPKYMIEKDSAEFLIDEPKTVLKVRGFLPGVYTAGAASLNPETLSINAWDFHGGFVKKFVATGKREGRTTIYFLSQPFIYPESPEQLHPHVREKALERLRHLTSDLPDDANYAERRRALILRSQQGRPPVNVQVWRCGC